MKKGAKRSKHAKHSKSAKHFERMTLSLFHATDPISAAKIRKSGFKLGTKGVAGPGIYFAKCPAAAKKKCRKNGSSLVVLRCEVQVGRVLKTKGTVSHDESNVQRNQMKQRRCDSVLITGNASKGTYCVYSPEQIAKAPCVVK